MHHTRDPKQLTVFAVQHRPGGDRLAATSEDGNTWRSAHKQSWANHEKAKGCTVFIVKMAGGDWITCTCKAKLIQPANVTVVPYPMPGHDHGWGK